MTALVLQVDIDQPCDQAGPHAGRCEGPIDEVPDDWAPAEAVEFLCRGHQKFYGQGHYEHTGTGWT